ncbi:MAG: peptide chain release factor N(5)-glutamine methyltransferase [Clostridia bacterium]|nr:peptide chain release factor N(5)-glutamine methyltransferase [Clostridia bacterium]
MTINEIKSTLDKIGVDNSWDEAYLIVEHVYGITKAKILLEPQKSYTSPKILEILEKRRARIPLQHIFGSWFFMGKEFLVSPDCLIPRPDTEILVEKAASLIKEGDKVADLCTGSGCIGISLALYCKNIDLTLVDISSGALNMARKNVEKHNVNAEFILGDITKDLPNKKFDIITSNPPYIPTKDIESLSKEVQKEPVIALDGGENGLDIINFLVNEGLSYLNENGKMLIEFGYDQEEGIRNLLDGRTDFKSYEILYDYGKNPRCAVIYK